MSSYRNYSDRYDYQSDGKLFHKEPSNLTEEINIAATTVRQRFRFCFHFVAFIFSHIGLGLLVLAYTIFGAFLFKHFEESNLNRRNNFYESIRNKTVNRLWIETYKLNVLYKENWTAMAFKEIDQFQRTLMYAYKDGLWILNDIEEREIKQNPNSINNSNISGNMNGNKTLRWSFIDSWMYSISIITTIGYANRPLTAEGKLATIVYALFGIPIMLLFLSTIGNLLGRGLKYLYSLCCPCSNYPSKMNSPLNLRNNSDDHNDSGHRQHHHLNDNFQVHQFAMNHIGAIGTDNNNGNIQHPNPNLHHHHHHHHHLVTTYTQNESDHNLHQRQHQHHHQPSIISACNFSNLEPSAVFQKILNCNRNDSKTYNALNSISTPFVACHCDVIDTETKTTFTTSDGNCAGLTELVSGGGDPLSLNPQEHYQTNQTNFLGDHLASETFFSSTLPQSNDSNPDSECSKLSIERQRQQQATIIQ
ncbi:hypothetical protein NH340_JMT00578 [Sarcoptes scabiei]|nr:hypothetical protein NH340_JMT00578 [Sarcoptes scabiei]